jgi:hypothetical protein
MENAILIWNWELAPQEYKDLSTNGGDEDWVVFINNNNLEDYNIEQYATENDYNEPVTKWSIPNWMEKLGACDVDVYEYKDGLVIIGSHA